MNPPEIFSPEEGLKALKASTYYSYYSEQGSLIFIIFRIEATETKPKWFCPYLYLPKEKKYEKGLSAERLFEVHCYTHRPLYNLQHKPTELHKPLLIVEGEKCVDAVQGKYGDKIWCVSNSGGGGGNLKNSDWTVLKKYKEIYFWPDNDKTGRESLQEFTSLHNADFLEINIENFAPKYDVYDWLQEHPEEDLLEFLRTNNTPHLNLNLKKNSKGQITNCISNLAEIFSKHPEWHQKLRFNKMSKECEVKTPNSILHTAGPIGDAALQDVRLWLARSYDFVQNPHRSDVYENLSCVARLNSYDPLEDMILRLKPWDKKDYFDPKEEWILTPDNEYSMQVIKYWMYDAIRRVFEPGCYQRGVLILESPKEKIGKSYFFKLLAMQDEFHCESHIEIGTDKGAHKLLGSWIIELAELNSVTKANNEETKQFLTQTTDSFRLPYARKVEKFKRRCVIAGTTNKSNYLIDPGEGTRFLPVEVININDKYLKQIVPQMWAQIFYLYKERIEVTLPDSIQEMREKKYDHDIWYDPIMDYLNSLSPNTLYTTLNDVAFNALHLPIEKRDKRVQNRIVECLRKAGWENDRRRVIPGQPPLRAWFRPQKDIK